MAKKKRWEAAEKKRQEQEVELESYLINLINNDKEKKLNLVDLDEEGAKRSAKVFFCQFFLLDILKLRGSNAGFLRKLQPKSGKCQTLAPRIKNHFKRSKRSIE